MEMRSLTRCLRSRPTTSLLSSQLPITRQSQISLRFSSTKSSPSPNRPQRRNQPKPTKPKPTQSIDEILNELNISSTRHRKVPGSSSSPLPDALSLSRAVSLSAETEPSGPAPPRPKVELKLGPTLGRQVHVEPERGVDLPSALRLLHSALSKNDVKNTFYAQRFHIRRGQLRKDLRSRRWRKLFKYSFVHTVAKIQRMRKQGW